MEPHVKSKQRVADHGEVLTGRREVNAMLAEIPESGQGDENVARAKEMRHPPPPWARAKPDVIGNKGERQANRVRTHDVA